jgi:2-methylcitrate dehydratase PrpD
MDTQLLKKDSAISEPLAKIFGHYASHLVQEVSEDALLKIKPYVLDTLAVMVAGSTADSSQVLLKAVARFAPSPSATVAGEGMRTDASHAALLNGAFAHALELDDDHRVAVLHPGAVIVPAALAACELSKASGRIFLTAVLAGYELTCRLGLAYRGSHFDHGLHPTAIFGAFGAALAASVGMRLNADATTNALGIVGTQACGLTEWRSDGSWIKRLHPGRAAQSGFLSACLAEAGFTGPETIFEGPGGFFRAMGHGKIIDIAAIHANLKDRMHGLDTALKPYPCCRFMHGAVDLAIEAFGQGVTTHAVARIDIRIYETNVLTYHQRPINNVDAQFNVPYGVACALTQGKLGLSDYQSSSIDRQDILDLCSRIHVSAHPPYTQAYPDVYNVELLITFNDNSVLRLHSTCPSGDPEAKIYQTDPTRLVREAENKAVQLLDECGFNGLGKQLIEQVDQLDGQSNIGNLLATISTQKTDT